MNDADQQMDQLLRKTMAAEAPRLSADFDARVIHQLRPRRPTTTGRAILAVYIVVATGATAWLLRDVPVLAVAGGLAASAALAGAASAYGRLLARSS